MAFASGPTIPGPTTNLVEKTARNQGRCSRHIVCPRTLLSRGRYGEGAPATPCGLAQLLSRTVSGEVRQPHHVASHSPFPNRFGEVRQPHHVASHSAFPEPVSPSPWRSPRCRCDRHVMRPRSTPFPSREWCGSHIMWPRTRPFPVFAPNRRRNLCRDMTVTIMVPEQPFDERSAWKVHLAGHLRTRLPVDLCTPSRRIDKLRPRLERDDGRRRFLCSQPGIIPNVSDTHA